ncbi:MAG TPA: hypothetical protein VK508_20220 [Cyclobacteriaceae bacterium]|nr:hypothetical protein [Cyclobacteriaceae bacterium]
MTAMTFRNIFPIILLAETMVLLLAVINYGWTLEGLQAVTRYSGRASLGIFSVIFLFHNHPVVNLKRVLSDKFFLVFAIAHGIHLWELLSYLYFSGTPIVPVRVAGGFVAYVMIFVMPWIQKKHDDQKVTDKRFKQIALIYLYYVWFIFFMTYLPRVRGTLPNVGGSYGEFVILLGWVSIMMGIKWSQLLAKPRGRT